MKWYVGHVSVGPTLVLLMESDILLTIEDRKLVGQVKRGLTIQSPNLKRIPVNDMNVGNNVFSGYLYYGSSEWVICWEVALSLPN